MQHFSHSDAGTLYKNIYSKQGYLKVKTRGPYLNANQYKHKKYKTWKIFIIEISDKTLIFFLQK